MSYAQAKSEERPRTGWTPKELSMIVFNAFRFALAALFVVAISGAASAQQQQQRPAQPAQQRPAAPAAAAPQAPQPSAAAVALAKEVLALKGSVRLLDP